MEVGQIGSQMRVNKMLVNISIQTFKSENDLELSCSRWSDVKVKYMPEFERLGLKRCTTTRIWNKQEKHQLAYIFEYDNEQAMKACLPVWSKIENEWREKIVNTTVGYRGIVIDQDDFSK